MDLIVLENTASFHPTQTFTPTKDMNLVAVRPHIYKHLSPTGTLKVQILDENGYLIDESESITISTISSANYFHGYVRFYIDTSLQSGRTYQMRLKADGGYTFSESAYVGICNDFDLRKVTAGYSPSDGYRAALDFELWERKNG